MTPNQLEKLDKKVAKGLGWTKFAYENLEDYKDFTFLANPRLIGLAPGNLRKQCVPHYTLNLAYAWKCVEFAKNHDIIFDMRVDPLTSGVKVCFYNEEGQFGKATHEAPSMAISLAFLNFIQNG